MSSKLTIADLDEVVRSFAAWLVVNSEDVAAELSNEMADTQPIVPVEPTTADLKAGVIVVAMFTARAAMRKTLKWFEASMQWKESDKREFLTTTVQELLDAIVNCDNVLYHLNAPAGPGLAEYLADPADSKGGNS